MIKRVGVVSLLRHRRVGVRTRRCKVCDSVFVVPFVFTRGVCPRCMSYHARLRLGTRNRRNDGGKFYFGGLR